MSAMEAWPLDAGGIISGAVGRTDLRGSAGAGAAFAGAGLAATATVGGPMEMAGISGRERGPPLLAAVAGVARAAALVPPTSMDRVTTTAGAVGAAACGAAACGAAGVAGAAAGVAGAGAGAACVAAAAFALAGAGLPLAGVVAGVAGLCCADFVDAGAFWAGVAGCCGEGPGPRPSFGGLCIDGASSAVLVDVASVSPLGLPEKSLEKTLIAEHQP